jgi:hypothetical protein
VQNVTPEQWYVDLIDHLIESFVLDVDLAEWWSENKLYSEVTRFRKFIEEVLLVEVQEKIVIFIDEIDSVLSLKFPTDDFFALIRACHNQRVDNLDYNRLTFCLLGVASPGNLIQDKQRTPFNIGKAINLKGFQLHEVEPLRRGLDGKFSDSLAVMQSILNWTGGQPFLTQKLCYFMVEESQKDNPRSVEQVVRARIIENWELQDEPEHLRTICSRILRDEERAGYLLELYQQVRASGEITNNDSIEQSELMLSGLVTKQENKLRVLNPIYYQVFNQNWIDTELKKLRPYSEAFRAWVASGCSDESRLLRGNALFDAEEWAKDKNLTHQDKEFLAASRKKEIQEEIAAQKKEAQLERERKDREAAEERNLLLTKANIKAKRQIRSGSAVLLLALLVAVISGIFATGEGNKALEAQKKLALIETDIKNAEKLSQLAGDLRNKNLEYSEANRHASLSFIVKDHNLKQALLLASMARAYKQLDNLNEANEKIKKSLEVLNKSQEQGININQKLQIKILAKNIEGNILEDKNEAQALNSYQEAFKIIQQHSRAKPIFYSNEINPFQQNQKEQILTEKDIESVHESLIKLLTKNLKRGDLETVRGSLKNHLYAGLKYSLEAKDWKAKNWEEADRKTSQLMLHIAKREKERFLDIQNIEQFSCTELKEIDNYWKQYSNGHFGFSVQKDEIYKETGNRLGVKLQDWNDKDTENFLNFARRVGWYSDKLQETEGTRQSSGGFVDYYDYIKRIKENPLSPSVLRGGLPLPLATVGLDVGLNPWASGTKQPLNYWMVVFFSRVATCKL